MAAISVFSSCRKEQADETPDTTAQADEVRVITLQFANSTKTALDSDGLTPKFENGDQILLSNGTKAPETATVSVAGGIATCTTKLKGTLKAVYPATAAKLNGKVIEGVLVPTEQDGTFKSANICMAENIDASANFVNRTALFEITPPSGATSVTIKSLKQNGTDGPRSGTATSINTDGADDAKKCEITVAVPAGGTAYVSLVPGVNLSDLSFDAGEIYRMKGIPMKDITAAGITNATAANTKYTIGNGNNTWHPYVVISSKKWATMNIGASSATDAGRYFAWGDVVGQTWSGSAWSGTGFSSAPAIGNPATLPLEYDAANANWGGPWRMPTSSEMKAMTDAAPGVFTTESSVEGYKFTEETSGNTIFFPAADHGDGPSLHDVGSYGIYWLSSGSSSNPDYAYSCHIGSSGLTPVRLTERYLGLSVRPVSD